MANPYDTIKTIIEGATTYDVKIQSVPVRREGHTTLPMVCISPSGNNLVYYIGMGKVCAEEIVDVFLIGSQNLLPTLNTSALTFQQTLIDQFMPTPTSLNTLGYFKTRVSPKYSYDRNVFPLGTAVSCFELNMLKVV